jgi:UDP-N-acetylglucosamine 2-epimerase (non-hydrolysing)
MHQSKRIKVLSVFGTRPEAIKMAPVCQELRKHPEKIESWVCVTGQHREMLDQVLRLFNIQPDYDFNVMRPNQDLSRLTSHMINKINALVRKLKPDWIFVQGDTTTVLVASLVAFYHKVNVAHVEAGLRTGDKHSPFPEEINRRVADLLSDLYFASTEKAKQHLLMEGVPAEAIVVTGNTVIDALLQVSVKPYDWSSSPLAGLPGNKKIILVTAHRREHFGTPFKNLCRALQVLARDNHENVHIVYPVHLNPNVQKPVQECLSGYSNISLIKPLEYYDLIHLMKKSYLILTDSGGIQEEAPSLGKPVLILRDATERPETIEAGNALLVGTDTAKIIKEASRLLNIKADYEKMAKVNHLYGDGLAAKRIVDTLLENSFRTE